MTDVTEIRWKPTSCCKISVHFRSSSKDGCELLTGCDLLRLLEPCQLLSLSETLRTATRPSPRRTSPAALGQCVWLCGVAERCARLCRSPRRLPLPLERVSQGGSRTKVGPGTMVPSALTCPHGQGRTGPPVVTRPGAPQCPEPCQALSYELDLVPFKGRRKSIQWKHENVIVSRLRRSRSLISRGKTRRGDGERGRSGGLPACDDAP